MRHWSSSVVVRDVGGADAGETDCMPLNGLAGRCGCHARARIVTAQRDSIPGTANTCYVAPYHTSSSPAAGLTCRYPCLLNPCVRGPRFELYRRARYHLSIRICAGVLTAPWGLGGAAHTTDRNARPWPESPTGSARACWRLPPASDTSPHVPGVERSSVKVGRFVDVQLLRPSVRLETATCADTCCPVW